MTVYCTFVTYLVGVVHEVYWDAEWQWMVVGVPQQDGDNLHTRRLGLPLSILQRSLHRPLTVHCILPHLTPLWKRKKGCKQKKNCFRTGFSYFAVFLSHFKESGVSYRLWATHRGLALRCRYCVRYQRKCCWGRNRATHRDNSCQHYKERC